MSMIDLTFNQVHCQDCGHVSDEAVILSASSVAPPPKQYSYDGSCPNCGSKNTEIKESEDPIRPPF